MQPIRSFNLICLLVLCLYMKITTCLLVFIIIFFFQTQKGLASIKMLNGKNIMKYTGFEACHLIDLWSDLIWRCSFPFLHLKELVAA